LDDRTAVNDNEDKTDVQGQEVRHLSFKSVDIRDLELLQEDVQRLFMLGDINGALISLERLVILGDGDQRLVPFIDRNEERLVAFFERIFDGFHQFVERVDDVEPLGPKLENVKLVDAVWSAVGTGTQLNNVLESVQARPLETAALLHHLLRTHRLRFVDS
jgi:hypothetical protein